jgi:hypothetical protein
MKKIIETARAAVKQTETSIFLLNRPFAAASSVAPNALTAPASDGVANPKRIDPFISVIKNT